MTGVAVAFLAAVLTGLGVGSGGLYLLYLGGVLGMPQYTAQGVNLVFFSAGTLASSLLSLLRGRLIPSRLIPILLGGTVGCAAGGLLTNVVPGVLARRLLGGLLLLFGSAGIRRILRRHRWARRKKASQDGGSP